MQTKLLAAVALVTASLAAQNPLAYPADTVRAGSGNLTPFGFSSSPNFDEGRWQQLIPAHYLPGVPCMLSGIAVNCQSSNAAVAYTNIGIELSHTTATSLGNSFSGNLPAPQPVLNAAVTVPWAINTWVTINFSTPFAYNGRDNLVVSLTKVYDRVTNPVPGVVTHQTTGSPHRTDLSPAKYAFSAFGLGGSTTDVVQFSTNAVLSMRLFSDAPATTTMRSVTQPAGKEYQIGTAAEYAVFGATGTAWGAFLDTALQPPISLPIFQGRLYVSPSILLASGTTAGGVSLFNLPIPNVPSLAGSYWTMQSATLSASLPVITMSNVIDFFITN
ncbi:MAG: hypothetical protein R3F56_20425 [Planctomycetota bacterium]